jgi:peptidyl-prolyl cis-trans isomerase SurA
MKRLIASLLAISLAQPLASAQSTSATGAGDASRGQAIEGVAVLVNDDVISYTDVRNRAELILLSLGAAQPDDETLLEAQYRAVEGLIEEKIQVQEFAELVKDQQITDAEIDDELATLARQNGASPETFLADLQSRGVNVQTLRDQIRADIAWTAIVRGRFARQVRVSELRIDEMMRRLEASLDKPQYRLAEIFLYAPDAQSREAARNRAATLRRQIEQGAPFELVAQQFSASPSASAGGDLGWLTPADMRAETLAAAEVASPPGFLPLIETEGGVYLYALLGKREPASQSDARLNLRQVIARGERADQLLQTVRTAAQTCAQVPQAIEGLADVTSIDLNDVALSGMADAFKSALSPLKAGGVSDPLAVSGGKAVFFVCERASVGSEIPTREQIRSRLFDTEITMLADRYLRDLKREATIIRR